MKIFTKKLLLIALCFLMFSMQTYASEESKLVSADTLSEQEKPFFCLPAVLRPYRNKKAKAVNIREQPTTSSKILVTLPMGEKLDVIEQTGEWFEVLYNDISGYVYWKYIGFIEEEITPNADLIANSIIHYTSKENRDYNIYLACKTINGTILKPNDEFRWSSIVGNANKEKGYLKAPVIINGKSVPGYGGGVCQVSTTIYNALFDTNITPTEHHKHSIGSSYAEHDATVAYGYKDFVFKNTYDFPILIESYSYKSIVFVNMYKVELK